MSRKGAKNAKSSHPKLSLFCELGGSVRKNFLDSSCRFMAVVIIQYTWYLLLHKHLQVIKLFILPILGKQLIVFSAFDNFSSFQNDNFIGMLNR